MGSLGNATFDQPFDGNINTADSSRLKLFLAAIKGPDYKERITFGPETAILFLKLVRSLSSLYGWVILIGLIPDSNADKHNMLQQCNSLKVRYVQAQATSYWGNRTNGIPTPLTITNLDPKNEENEKIQFYKRVRSEMISKSIEAHLTTSSFNKLLLNNKDFTWTKDDRTTRHDGPTMLLICL